MTEVDRLGGFMIDAAKSDKVVPLETAVDDPFKAPRCK